MLSLLLKSLRSVVVVCGAFALSFAANGADLSCIQTHPDHLPAEVAQICRRGTLSAKSVPDAPDCQVTRAVRVHERLWEIEISREGFRPQTEYFRAYRPLGQEKWQLTRFQLPPPRFLDCTNDR